MDRACREHVAINVTGARGEAPPPPYLPLERGVHPPPPRPPLPAPPFLRLIHSDTHPFLRRDAIGNKEWQDSGARGRRPVVRARRHLEGGEVRTLRVATAVVLLRAEDVAQTTHSKGRVEAGQPGDRCASLGIGSYRLRNAEKPSELRAVDAARAAAEADGEFPTISVERSARRAYEPSRQSWSTFRRLRGYRSW